MLNVLDRQFITGSTRPIYSPQDGQRPDHVVVDETVIRLNDEQYWLYAAVNPETNELLHTTLEPTTNTMMAHAFVAELREKHDVEDAVFLINGSHSVNAACARHDLDFRYEGHGNRNSVERIFIVVKRRISSFSNCFSKPRKTLLTTGSEHSASHGISLSEQYPSSGRDR